MTTLKTGSVLTTGTGAGDTAPGLLVTFNASHVAGQSAILVMDHINAPIFGITDVSNGKTACFGDYLGARKGLLDAGNMRADGNPTRDPACFLFPDGTGSAGARWWSGTGAPSSTTIGGAASVGDIYTRIDGGSGTYVYQCTVAGSPGTWQAVN